MDELVISSTCIVNACSLSIQECVEACDLELPKPYTHYCLSERLSLSLSLSLCLSLSTPLSLPTTVRFSLSLTYIELDSQIDPRYSALVRVRLYVIYYAFV